jgi:hypothetical protein
MLLGMHIVHGLVALAGSECVSAREQLLEALTPVVSSEDPLATAQVVEYMAHLASCVGQSDVALRLATAAGWRARRSMCPPPVYLSDFPTCHCSESCAGAGCFRCGRLPTMNTRVSGGEGRAL